MPLQATSGAASYDGFGGGAAAVPNYIEDVFSTYLYTGNGSTQTITNGIDTSTYGGLVWLKDRSSGQSHALSDTARGVGTSKQLRSNTTGAATTDTFTGFTTTGFTLDASFGAGAQNLSAVTYASWTFREQPKFFDVVTYTGNGTTQQIAHNLGSAPGAIFVKRTDSAASWRVYHRSTGKNKILYLNLTNAETDDYTATWNDTNPTSTFFSIGSDTGVNASGGTYVAYLFAHDAGGFGLTGTDNVISCGSFTADGSGGVTVDLGYEPQWIMYKSATRVVSWTITDNMRGWHPQTTVNPRLRPNTADAETTSNDQGILSTGFNSLNNFSAGETVVYIAIRRGPMKVPTLGTSVYNAVVRTGTRAVANLTGLGFTPDTAFVFDRNAQSADSWFDRLRGVGIRLRPHDTGAEQTFSDTVTAFNMDGISYGADATANSVNYSLTSNAYINWFFRRAPGFFDEVCYTGNYAGNPQIPHNLGVVPEMLIARSRVGVYQWYVKHIGMSDTEEVYFNAGALSAGPTWVRTSTYWQYSSAQYPNDAHVAYLFATCPGVSKVGSYTGTATTLQIDCGFTAGARFVLIKRTDSTGDWYVWDSARGIVAGNDPYLLLNSTAAEVTSTDYVDTYSAGFEISSTAPAAINASGGSFIFLAVA